MNLDFLTNKKIWLAPLAGVSDKSFRYIAKICGADVTVSEMVSADGIVHESQKTIDYMYFDDFERPFGIQLFASDAKTMYKAVLVAAKLNPDFIDINMGCPVKKVVKRKSGSALMQYPDLAFDIVKAAKSAMPENMPLGVKFRLGWDSNSINCIEFGQLMQKAGADFVCLHARTKTQMYSGKADWSYIKKLKQAVDIPVIGNGDVIDFASAVKMFDETNCDSIMIGRGSIGNPWIFKQIKMMQNKNNNLLSSEYKLKIIRQHFDFAVKYKGNEKAVREMRPHFSKYTKGLKGGSFARDFINRCEDYNTIIDVITKLYERNK